MLEKLKKHSAAKRARRVLKPAWLGTLRRLTPISPNWGYDRGTPIDRYYIERFIAENREDVRGRVLEVKDRTYTDRFGHAVACSDVLDVNPTNTAATLKGNLEDARNWPTETFDCIILTQTLQLIYDVGSAVINCHCMLRAGGVLLATVPCASRIVRETDLYADYWRFTEASSRRIFAEAFGAANVEVRTKGNVLSMIAFLAGMAHQELKRSELHKDDPDFPLLITVRAVKV